VLPPSHVSLDDYGYAILSTLGALLLAGLGLFGRPLRARIPRPIARTGESGVYLVRGLHSGHVGDYIAWWSAGVSLVGGICLVTLR
jgi:hypothetical protein